VLRVPLVLRMAMAMAVTRTRASCLRNCCWRKDIIVLPLGLGQLPRELRLSGEGVAQHAEALAADERHGVGAHLRGVLVEAGQDGSQARDAVCRRGERVGGQVGGEGHEDGAGGEVGQRGDVAWLVLLLVLVLLLLLLLVVLLLMLLMLRLRWCRGHGL